MSAQSQQISEHHPASEFRAESASACLIPLSTALVHLRSLLHPLPTSLAAHARIRTGHGHGIRHDLQLVLRDSTASASFNFSYLGPWP